MMAQLEKMRDETQGPRARTTIEQQIPEMKDDAGYGSRATSKDTNRTTISFNSK